MLFNYCKGWIISVPTSETNLKPLSLLTSVGRDVNRGEIVSGLFMSKLDPKFLHIIVHLWFHYVIDQYQIISNNTIKDMSYSLPTILLHQFFYKVFFHPYLNLRHLRDSYHPWEIVHKQYARYIVLSIFNLIEST